MKIFAGILLLAALASCYGYSYIIPAGSKHPGVCYYNGHYLPRGNNQMPTTCQNIQCNDDGSILVQGCGGLHHPECTLLDASSLDKPYPQCCEMTYRCTDANGNTYTKQWNRLVQSQDDDSNESGESYGFIQGLFGKGRNSRDIDSKKYEKQIQKERKQAEKLIKNQLIASQQGQLGYDSQYQPDNEDNVRYAIQITKVPGEDYVLAYGRQNVLGNTDKIRSQGDAHVGHIGYGRQVQAGLSGYGQGGYASQGSQESRFGYGNQVQGSRVQDYLSGYSQESQNEYENQVQNSLRASASQRNRNQDYLSGYVRGGYANQGNQESRFGYGNQVQGGNHGNRVQDYLSGYSQESQNEYENQVQNSLRASANQRNRNQDYLSGYNRAGQIRYGNKAGVGLSGKYGSLAGYAIRGSRVQSGSNDDNREEYVNQGGPNAYNQGRSSINDLRGYNPENGFGNFKDQGYLSGSTGGVEIVYTNKAIRNQDDVREGLSGYANVKNAAQNYKSNYGLWGQKNGGSQAYQVDDYIVGDY